MFKPGKIKKYIILFGLLIGISTPSFAIEDLIIPEICVERAHQMGVFYQSPNSSETRKKFQISQASWQVYNFDALYNAYEQTLLKVASDVENYKTPLFDYLQNCKNNEAECHGYFQVTNPYHLQIFCDREILRSSIETILQIKDTRFDTCTNQPFDERELAAVEQEKISYNKSCYKQIERDGIIYLKNRADTYYSEILWVDSIRRKMVDKTIRVIQKSLIPEGIEFILMKTIEEFQDLSIRSAKINDLNTFHKTQALVRQFSQCSGDNDANLPEYQKSLDYFGGVGTAFESMEKPDAIVFHTRDYLSELAFLEAERQKWRDLLLNNSPLDLSEEKKFEYFQFLNRDSQFCLVKGSSFNSFITDAKTKKRSDFAPRELTFQEWQEYQRKLGYVYRDPPSYQLQDKSLPDYQRIVYDYGGIILGLDGGKKLETEYVFNPDFRQLYKKQLQSEHEAVVEEKFQDGWKDELPRIFRGFLPYQFARTAQAKIIREIQKMKQSEATRYLKDVNSFQVLAEFLTCKGFENSFCEPDSKVFRKKKYAELYEKLITGVIPLEYAYEGNKSRRTFIYSNSFLNGSDGLQGINGQIRNINKFCWENADKENFKSDPKSFESKVADVDQLIEAFYETPRIEELLGQEDFIELLQFDPNDYYTKCFTRGFIFGKSLPVTPEGQKVTRSVYAGTSTPGIPIYSEIEAKDDGLALQKAYYPSKFNLLKEDIEDIEEDIEEKTQDEFDTLLGAHYFSEDPEYEEFLKESATVRLFALIDYAVDNPSEEMGKYLCRLIIDTDMDEYSAIQRREFFINAGLIAASVATIFVLPELAAFTAARIAGSAAVAAGATEASTTAIIAGTTAKVSVIYESGIALTFAGVSSGFAYANVRHYNRKHDLTDMAVLTKNLSAKDAMQLHAVYDEHISAAKMSIMTNVGLVLIISARPLYLSAKYIQKITDKRYMFIRADRQNMIEEFMRTAPKNDFYITSRMGDFLYDFQKVSKSEFDDFFQAFRAGDGEDFILGKWNSQLTKYLPVKRIPSRSFKERFNSLATAVGEKAPVLRTAYDWLAEQNSIYLQPYWYRIKPYYNEYFRNYFSPTLRNETRMVKMLENAKALSIKVEKTIFTDDEVAYYASKMKNYKFKDGVFKRIFSEDMEKVIDRFMIRSVTGDSYAIRAYLEPMIEGELLDVAEWELILKSFTRQINNIDDCKTFLKAIKYSKMEHADLWSQMKNFPELFHGKEIFNRTNLFKPYVYEKRFKIIAKHIDEFYDLAQYKRYDNNTKTVEAFKKLIADTGKPLDEIEASIQAKYKDFSLKKLFENYEKEKRHVLLFDETRALQPQNSRLGQTTRELFKDEQALVTSYKKDFLKQEEEINEYFHKQLLKNFKKESDVGLAYQNAYIRTKVQKNTEYECSLPDSKIRKEVNETYKRLAGKISVGTNMFGYLSVHGGEEITPEWVGRLSYESAVSYFGGKFQAKIFTTSGGGPVYKITHDLLSGWLISAIDSSIYGGVNTVFWDKKWELEQKFKDIIYESNDVQQTVHQYFKDHPEIEERILQEYQKIQVTFDQLELTHGKGTMVDSEMEEAFLRAGLIDNVLYSDMEIKDRELGKGYLYHDLIESGYLDKDLYRKAENDEDLETQILELISEAVYEDLYDHKSGKIRFPFVDPIELGNHEYVADLPIFPDIPGTDLDLPGVDIPVEIHTGNEALDRFIFHSSYDVLKTPIAYAKSNITYRILCKGRFLPGNTSVAAALALHIAYKATMDPLKFYLREQATGR